MADQKNRRTSASPEHGRRQRVAGTVGDRAGAPRGPARFAAAALAFARRIDVQALPQRERVMDVLPVAPQPGCDDGAFGADGVRAPGRVRGDNVGHLRVERRALRPVGRAPALQEQRVELGIAKTSQVRLARAWAMELLHVVVAHAAGEGECPELELSRVRRLGEIRPLLFVELDLEADRGEAALPQLVVLA